MEIYELSKKKQEVVLSVSPLNKVKCDKCSCLTVKNKTHGIIVYRGKPQIDWVLIDIFVPKRYMQWVHLVLTRLTVDRNQLPLLHLNSVWGILIGSCPNEAGPQFDAFCECLFVKNQLIETTKSFYSLDSAISVV